MTWKGEKMKKLNRGETDKGGHAAGVLWFAAGACTTCAKGESEAAKNAERVLSSHMAGCDWLVGFLSI
ncbi:hypothetical protein L195_g048504 [Trifolium pratense]|uniref:Uncharacterized protein n=1 Tax=Trifolium pratense TaxID=57577 RepID=A0A2K3JLH7_TRIPR|nr:hypothetical protein L195_g048504 [Trifolium pratense]